MNLNDGDMPAVLLTESCESALIFAHTASIAIVKSMLLR